MSRVRTAAAVLCAASFLLQPVAGFAASRSITDVVNATAQTVTRAEFLRWSAELLGIDTSKDCALPYKRVPAAITTVICAANERKALAVFGSDLQLARPITRGDALIVITALTGKASSQNVEKFRDVTGTALTKAVQNAVQHRWMNPDSETSFGIKRMLSGAEALSMLSAVTGNMPARQERQRNTVRIRFENPSVTTSTSGVAADIPQSELLRTVWQLLQRDYLRTQGIDNKEAGYSMIEGLVKGLNDPYTTFMRPVAAENFQTQIRGNLSGIGAHVEDQGGKIVIVAPLPGSPAEKAGLKAGDVITDVGGTSLAGKTIDEAIKLIRGEKGTSVDIKFTRSGQPQTLTIVRDNIVLPEIEVTWRDNIAIVKLVQFGETTDEKMRGLLADIAEDHPRGIVLDLRNNPGGLLHAAKVVVSNFVPKDSVVAQVKGRTSSSSEVTEEEPVIPSSVKLVVLVNEGSASASEIVAGALQDHGRAKIVGVKTFGKGTVQELLTFSTGEALKMTIAEWLTPKGRKIDKIGVVPDIVVENVDQQLQRAISEAK